MGATACVAIYQAPQAAYDLFDKVLLLYEGRQIFFGRTGDAKKYFTDMGFDCPDRQTMADFLTSMTSPRERRSRPGWDYKVPRTPNEFAQRWRHSYERKQLLQSIQDFDIKYPIGGPHVEEFKALRREQQAKNQ
jgi:ATP-binding cassette subfamily G (WHITE) protein 2 (PDR)